MTTHRILPSPPGSWSNWQALMRLALAEAALAADKGEVPVGAIVVAPDGGICSRAHNAPVSGNDPTAHAEVLALRGAARSLGNYRLTDCVLIVTLEPCLMCTGALVHARVKGVVYGAADPRAGAVTSQLDGLELPHHNHSVWHCGGILEDECAALLRDFFASRRNKGAGETP